MPGERLLKGEQRANVVDADWNQVDRGPANSIAELVDSVALMICDDAHSYADRLHTWADSGEDVRATYRALARQIVSLVAEYTLDACALNLAQRAAQLFGEGWQTALDRPEPPEDGS